MEQKQHAGAYVRQIRKEQRMSLRQLAKSIDVSATFVSRFERGEKDAVPSVENLKKMADVLGIDADDLIFRAKKMPTDLPEIVQSHTGMAALLRTAQGLTEDQLRELTEQARKEAKKKE